MEYCIILWISISQPWIFFSVISQWQMHWKNLQTHLNTYASSVCLDVPTLDGVYYVIWPHSMEQTTTIQTLGHVVYTYYMVFFFWQVLYYL